MELKLKKGVFYFLLLVIVIILILELVKIFFLNHDYKITKYNEDKIEKGIVITFHGIYGTEKQLRYINENLANKGYTVDNIQYPTLEENIVGITEEYIKPVIDTEIGKLKVINKERAKKGLEKLKINIVAHSMGTVIARYYLKNNKIEDLGEVILISPPSHGSDLSDIFISNLLKNFLGVAVLDMKTDKSSFVNGLGEPSYSCHVLIGNKTNNFLYSLLIKGEDDGMVPVSTAKLDKASFKIIDNATHTSILKSSELMKEILDILEK